MVSKQIVITGKVQNVGFRYHTHDKALQLGLNGFVMNRPDGSVYCEVEGLENSVNEFVAWCHKGPTWARVANVHVVEQPLCHYQGFEIKR